MWQTLSHLGTFTEGKNSPRGIPILEILLPQDTKTRDQQHCQRMSFGDRLLPEIVGFSLFSPAVLEETLTKAIMGSDSNSRILLFKSSPDVVEASQIRLLMYHSPLSKIL